MIVWIRLCLVVEVVVAVVARVVMLVKVEEARNRWVLRDRAMALWSLMLSLAPRLARCSSRERLGSVVGGGWISPPRLSHHVSVFGLASQRFAFLAALPDCVLLPR